MDFGDDQDADLQRALAMSLEASNTATTAASTDDNPTGAEAAPPPQPDDEEDQEEDDEDLAAALRLSLETATPAVEAGDLLEPLNWTDPASFPPHIQESYQTATPTNMKECHGVLWEVGTTTVPDQQRWLAQPIDFKARDPNPEIKARHPQSGSSLLATILCHSELWGLTQAHGGPCGVLASIQAEMMRLLLFGPRTSDESSSGAAASTDSASSSSILPLHIPTQLTNHFCQAKPDLSPSFLRATLALSIGIILARAALEPNVEQQDDEMMDTSTSTSMLSDTVKLVFPKSDEARQVEWGHLEPWDAATAKEGDSASHLSEHLITYSISVPAPSTSESPSKKSSHTLIEEREELLAQAVAVFLLETNFLECYHRPGGVVMFVLALIQSRGAERLVQDMDDPTAKLTTQFGHCSQELINLLLTGQAVSNVFDNTLRPSGGALICQGIQRRPVIGYLSLLESMRYLEVGSYYKTPQFPIWVIGSTSHFTVMFGDATCLVETPSDRILEKVRRTFKQMDGAEEQGFIQIGQFQDFLQKLGLYPKTIQEAGVQTLGATIEVHGAGILLWEDVWKKVSRLMTGASLQAVLDDDGKSNNRSNTSQPQPPPVAPPPRDAATAAMSDEELARRLQAEWNGDTLPATAPAPQPAAPVAKPPQYGQTFQLYHYNGLRGGYMKPFRITRLSSEEAIGASGVPLGSSSGNIDPHHPPKGLEDVLRTKWPSCKIDWINHGDPPSID